MKLWTIQPVTAINDINEKGVFRCIPELAPDIADGSYVRPYNWLVDHMKKEVGDSPEGILYPIWAWYLVGKQNKKPDMRTNAFRRYSPSVLIELEIPDEVVFLTDYEMWHCILNNGPIYNANYDAKTDEEFERMFYEDEAYYESLTWEEKEAYKLASWERIIYHLGDDYIPAYVQATFWEIRKEYVKRVFYLKGYKKPAWWQLE